MRIKLICLCNIEKWAHWYCTSLKARYRRCIYVCRFARCCMRKTAPRTSSFRASPSSAPRELDVHIQTRFDEPRWKNDQRCGAWMVPAGTWPRILSLLWPRRRPNRAVAVYYQYRSILPPNRRAREARKAGNKLNCAVEMGTAVGRSKAHFR